MFFTLASETNKIEKFTARYKQKLLPLSIESQTEIYMLYMYEENNKTTGQAIIISFVACFIIAVTIQYEINK